MVPTSVALYIINPTHIFLQEGLLRLSCGVLLHIQLHILQLRWFGPSSLQGHHLSRHLVRQLDACMDLVGGFDLQIQRGARGVGKQTTTSQSPKQNISIRKVTTAHTVPLHHKRDKVPGTIPCWDRMGEAGR